MLFDPGHEIEVLEAEPEDVVNVEDDVKLLSDLVDDRLETVKLDKRLPEVGEAAVVLLKVVARVVDCEDSELAELLPPDVVVGLSETEEGLAELADKLTLLEKSDAVVEAVEPASELDEAPVEELLENAAVEMADEGVDEGSVNDNDLVVELVIPLEAEAELAKELLPIEELLVNEVVLDKELTGEADISLAPQMPLLETAAPSVDFR